jgi:hypothetical protein
VVQNMTKCADLPDGGQLTTVVNPACAPVAPPPFDGTDKQMGEVIFHAATRGVMVVTEGLRCEQFADPTSCETRSPLRQGETFEALYWVEGRKVAEQRRGWIAKSGSQLWGGGTSPQPGETG